MAIRLKNNIYYVVYRDLRGKVNSRSLKTSDYSQAVMYHDLFMRNLRYVKQKRAVFADFPQFNVKPNTFTDNMENPRQNRLKLKNMIDLAKSKRDISQKHISAMGYFVDRLKNVYQYADEITSKIALDYMEQFYNKGNGKNYNNIKSCLNTVFRCCLIEANLQQSPFANIINKQVKDISTHRNLSDNEIEQLMRVSPLPMQVMIMLSRWTAQRLETCARMTPAMFNFESKVFVIQPSKTARFNKFVCVPIMPELENFIKPILRKCKNKEKPIIQQITDLKYSNHLISKNFIKLLNQCNIPITTDNGKAGFHSLRGSAITYFKELGISSDDLRLITGHTTDRMEAIYDRSTKQISRIAMNSKGD